MSQHSPNDVPPKKNSSLWIILGVGCLGCGGLGVVVLAAILLPVLASARQAAVKTQCLSNMKRLGLANLLYANDNNDMLPADKWEERTFAYTKADTPLFCPTKTASEVGYATNGALSGKKLPSGPDAEKVIMLFETIKNGRNVVGNPAHDIDLRRHGSMSNVARADGSAKSIKAL